MRGSRAERADGRVSRARPRATLPVEVSTMTMAFIAGLLLLVLLAIALLGPEPDRNRRGH